MYNICKHGCGKIKTKNMNFCIQTLFDQQKHPMYQLIFPINFHHTLLHWTFLKNCKTKSLSYTSIVLFLQNLNEFIATLITLSRTDVSVPPAVRYSIPLRVDTMTDIREVTACRRLLFLMLRISMRKEKLSFWVILKISLRISY